MISKKIAHDRYSSKAELEAVLIHLEHGSFKYYEEDPAEIAKNRLIRMKFEILKKREIERKRLKKEERRKKIAEVFSFKQKIVQALVGRNSHKEKMKKVEK